MYPFRYLPPFTNKSILLPLLIPLSFIRFIITIMRRVISVSVASPIARAFAVTTAARSSGVKSTDETYEDARWLEAQFAAKESTPEERYAANKQLEIMKSMMARLREDTNTKVAAVQKKEADARTERDAKIDQLHAQIAQLQKTLADITTK